jgi:pyruvate dehydrogenase E1 component alpha subunit
MEQLKLLKDMMRIRRMEELCAELYTQQKIRGFLHLYIGEEAVASGVLSQAKPHDNVMATYREHGHALLKGISARSIMAEMFGKLEGCSRGRGGSMHLFSREERFFGGNAIVGGGLPQAVGLAFAAKTLKEDRSTFCFFGEGAIAEGAFHESMNLARLWNVPVIFCCENNLYAMGTALARSESQTDLTTKAAAYDIRAVSIDGMDVEAVCAATKEAVNYTRQQQRPIFLEFKTYRFRPHSMFDPELYRKKKEVEEWRKRCPIETFKSLLISKGVVDETKISQLTKDVEAEMMDAVEFANRAGLEPVSDLEKFVYAENVGVR